MYKIWQMRNNSLFYAFVYPSEKYIINIMSRENHLTFQVLYWLLS